MATRLCPDVQPERGSDFQNWPGGLGRDDRSDREQRYYTK